MHSGLSRVSRANPAGQLTVAGRFAAGRIEALKVQLERPPVARMFIGQSPVAVIKAVPLLYSLCSHAQAAAARSALAAATGAAGDVADQRALWLEFLHENLWRLLLDWPLALGLPPARDDFVAWRAQRSGADCIPATRALVSGALQRVAKNCLEKLVDRDEHLPANLPVLTPQAWLAFWRGQAGAAPLLQRPSSVALALRQRLAEVAVAAGALAAETPYPCAAAGADGWGVGLSLTARGVLTHAVLVENNLVKKYQVWAPTDCHFADASGLQALTEGQVFASQEDAGSVLKLAVLALDPCLPYEVELSHA